MSLSGYRLSGLALIIGTLLGVVAALITPGTLFVDMVDQVNIRERQAAFVDNAFLTHLTSSGAIIAQALLLTGLFALWPRSDHGSAGAALRRAGIVTLTGSIIIAMAALSLPHIEVHIFDHQLASGIDGDPATLGHSLQLVGAAFMFSAFIASYIAHICLALGFVSKFSSDGRKWAAKVVALVSFVGLVTFLIGAHNHDLIEFAVLGTFGIFVTGAWTLALGVWLVKEDPEVAE